LTAATACAMLLVMRRRKGSSAPRRLGEILPETLKKKALYLPTKDRPLIDAWNQAVGPQIGSKAQPDRLKDDVLYVRVSTSVWMHELQFMKQDIIAKLNAIIGGNPVTQIRFFIGEIEAAPAKLDERALLVDARELKPAEKDFIAGTISEVTDPELREVLEKAMKRSIQRGLKDS
jgi:predicted nucleic acid-binding Zn ribbon protein